ncbi:MAG: tRNA lysidine(34) synthetase TilS [Bacteroidales bacterium]|jgi:tRNA(Ile)-lysidine synthase|nr:tRNA lysidine(34) synthetase TilS [Bacteroidales bacterium]
MIKEFENFIRQHNLFTKNDRLLVAVSGGVDSMVLCRLLRDCNYVFAVAHCNFHLRDEESDRDKDFVVDYCEQMGIENCFTKDFNTISYMQSQKISLEMAARELRYQWFEDLKQRYGYDYLLTAHHNDDSAESLFINLLRGTGIAGLHGILPKRNGVVRPMLFATKAEIVDFAAAEGVKHINDSSNQSLKITRNRIRNEVFPIFREISPNFDSIIRRNIERFAQTEEVFRARIERIRGEVVEKDGDVVRLAIDKLKQLKPLNLFLYEILSDFGFNESNINAIEASIWEDISGKQFFSASFRAVRDRQYIIISKIESSQSKAEYPISEDLTLMNEPLELEFEILRDLNFISIPKERTIAMTDFDKLKFPLTLRKWKRGDSFVPIGLAKTKKVSDFFTNLKYSLLDKENQWILCSGDDIVWILGKRLDERFKITEQTKTIYRIQIKQNLIPKE